MSLITKNILHVNEADTSEASKLLISFMDSVEFTQLLTESLFSFCRIRPGLTDHAIDTSYKVKIFILVSNTIVECTKRMNETTSMILSVIFLLVKALLSLPLIIRSKDMFIMKKIISGQIKRIYLLTQ